MQCAFSSASPSASPIRCVQSTLGSSQTAATAHAQSLAGGKSIGVHECTPSHPPLWVYTYFVRAALEQPLAPTDHRGGFRVHVQAGPHARPQRACSWMLMKACIAAEKSDTVKINQRETDHIPQWKKSLDDGRISHSFSKSFFFRFV